MALSNDALERELANDLQTLGDLIHDDSFYPELYKAFAGVPWTRADGEGHIALSWKRTEELLNEVRAKHDKPKLQLAQTGGEGEVSDRVADALDPLGWSPGAKTGRHDDAHVTSRPDAPPRGAEEAPEWEQQAHAEAEENRRR